MNSHLHARLPLIAPWRTEFSWISFHICVFIFVCVLLFIAFLDLEHISVYIFLSFIHFNNSFVTFALKNFKTFVLIVWSIWSTSVNVSLFLYVFIIFILAHLFLNFFMCFYICNHFWFGAVFSFVFCVLMFVWVAVFLFHISGFGAHYY